MDRRDNSLVDWSQHKTNKKKKAQQELKKCLGSEPEDPDETVIKSYSCAWQKDILVQGHLHLTQNWICFYSNILGWETKTSISLKDVTSISKQKTALVFPYAILIEAGDKKYGFASFVHRDRSYNVLQLIWQNSQLQNPSDGEALREQIGSITWQQTIGSRSKSSSFTAGDSSDVELSSAAHSPSHSAAHANNRSTHLKVDVTQVATDASESDWGAEDGEQVDGEVYMAEHPSSTGTSDAGSENSSTGSSGTPLDDPDKTSDVHVNSGTTKQPFFRKKQKLNRSPSLLTLKPSMSEASAIQSEALLGGSPNFLHHWKRTLSAASIWQTVVTLAKPQHLTQMCSPSRLISVLIIVFIVLLMLSTVSMLCQLSKVEPALQPYLHWQPWCSLR